MKLTRKGQGLVEYILIVALVAMIAYAVVTLLGSNVKDVFNKAAGKVKDSESNW